MNKFWAGANSDSDGSGVSDVEEPLAQVPAAPAGNAPPRKQDRAWAAIEDSSSDESHKRVLKSEKEKKWSALREVVKSIDAHKRTGAYVELQQDFDLLMKQKGKAESLILTEGIPRFLLQCIFQLQAYVEARCKDKEGIKKVSKTKATALNRLRAKIPKATAEFKGELDEYAAHLEASQSKASDGERGSSSSAGSSSGSSSSSDESSLGGKSDSEDDEMSRRRRRHEQQVKRRKASMASSRGDDEPKVIRDTSDISSSYSDSSGSISSSSSSSNSSDGEDAGSATASEASSSSSSEFESSSSDEGSAESSSSESEAEVLNDDAGYEDKHKRAMLKWGLKQKTPEEEAAEKEKEKAKKAKALAAKAAAAQEKTNAKKKAQEEIAAMAQSEARRASVLFGDGEPITDETVAMKLKEVGGARWKRRVEKLDQLKMLKVLARLAEDKLQNWYIAVEAYSLLVTLTFDIGQNQGMAVWSPQSLRELFRYIDKLFGIFLKKPELRFTHSMAVLSGLMGALDSTIMFGTTSTTTTTAGGAAEQTGSSSTTTSGPSTTGLPHGIDPVLLAAKELSMTTTVMSSFMDRADDILAKCLQAADMQSREFRGFLGCTIQAIACLWKGYIYFKRLSLANPTDTPNELFRTVLRLLEHNYYAVDEIAIGKWEFVRRKLSGSYGGDVALESLPIPNQMKPSELVCDLANQVFIMAPMFEGRGALRALLQVIFSKAIHDSFWEARDLFTALNLQDMAWNGDIADQVLHNRCVAQLGLSAFRQGLLQDAFNCLSDVCGMNRQRELLAQGVSVVKGVEKTIEQEKAERRRLLPAHMHMNLDVVEGCYNICALLVEIPQLAASANSGFDGQKPRIPNSRFRRMFEAFEKSTTPPENAREQIMAAGKALRVGNWKVCEEIIMNLKFWEAVTPASRLQQMQDMVKWRVRKESLRAYVLTSAKVYDSMSVAELSKVFAMEVSDIKSVLAKMMLSGELPGLWEKTSNHLLINKVDPSGVQLSAMRLMDKLTAALESNEACIGLRKGGSQAPTTRTVRTGGSSSAAPLVVH